MTARCGRFPAHQQPFGENAGFFAFPGKNRPNALPPAASRSTTFHRSEKGRIRKNQNYGLRISRPPEPLESRIVPSNFFLSGTSLDITNSHGTSVNLTATATAWSADAVVLLHAGDNLILDRNGDRKFDAGDKILVHDSAGNSMVFATHFETTGNGFTGADISGLAVSNGFAGSVYTNVNGSVVTALNARNQISGSTYAYPGSLEILHSSIEQLRVTGIVTDSIIAGGNLSHISVGQGIYTHEQLGTFTNLPKPLFLMAGGGYSGYQYTGRPQRTYLPSVYLGRTFALYYSKGHLGDAGGNISDVHIEAGAVILAGAGGDNSHGNGAHGGSISNVWISGQGAIGVYAGDGGSTTGHAGMGGTGGSIHNAFLNGTERIAIYGGSGGNGIAVGDKSHPHSAYSVLHQYSVGGAGGNITYVAAATSTATINAGMFVFGGAGGQGGSSGPYHYGGVAGKGGSVLHDSFSASGDFSTVYVEGGGGGYSKYGYGGPGGAVAFSSVKMTGTMGVPGSYGAVAEVTVTGGGGGVSPLGVGGNGGALTHNSIVGRMNFLGYQIDIRGGFGASGAYRAGNGGSLDQTHIVLADGINATGTPVVLGNIPDPVPGITIGGGSSVTPA